MAHASETRPLLTLAIPTWNRARYLRKLLDSLSPQMASLPEVELLISDNASSDETQPLIESAIASGLRCQYVRNVTNIGVDANFLQCFEKARGTYFWIVGDDDLLLPGSLDFIVSLLHRNPVELLYARPFPYFQDVDERGLRDSHPVVREYTSRREFLRGVGLRGDLIMISSMIVNKDEVDRAEHPAFSEGYKTNLLQMGWVFTALRSMRSALIVERGLIASCDREPRRDFDLVRTFGLCWARAARIFLSPDQALVDLALDDQLYSWFVMHWIGLRRNTENIITDPVRRMLPVYGHRLRFWLVTWPLLAWPLPLARLWASFMRLLRGIDRILDKRRHPPLEWPG